MIVLVNQFCGPLCRDMAYALADQFGEVKLIAGNVTIPIDQTTYPISLHKGPEYNRKNFSLRFLSWISFCSSSFFKLLFSSRKDAVWVLVSNPPVLPLVLGLLAGLKKIPFFIVVYDLYPDVLDHTGLANSNSALFRIWGKLNVLVFKKATALFTLSAKMQEALNRYLPEERFSDVYIIPNWADTLHQRPSEAATQSFQQAHSLQGQFIVLYSGNMGMTHDLESLVECAALLKDEKDILFVFAGDGYKKIRLQQLAQSLNLLNVKFLPFQSNEAFPVLMACATIGVITMGAGAEGFSVPSKTYSALAAGQCILSITPRNSELDSLVSRFNLGINITTGNANGAAEFILSVRNSPILANIYKQNSLIASTEFTVLNAGLYSKYMRVYV